MKSASANEHNKIVSFIWGIADDVLRDIFRRGKYPDAILPMAEETDPNKLHDLKATLDDSQVYSQDQVRQLVELFLADAERDKLDPILDACVAVHRAELDEDGQVGFKGNS